MAYIIMFLAFVVCSASCDVMYFKPAYIIMSALMPDARYVISVRKMHTTSFILFMMSPRGSVLIVLFSVWFAQAAFERQANNAARNIARLFSIVYVLEYGFIWFSVASEDLEEDRFLLEGL